MSYLLRLNEAINKLKAEKKIKDQAQIAADLGYKRAQTISDLATGKATITTKFVIAFCNKYGINQVWFDTGEGDMFIKDEGGKKNDENHIVSEANSLYSKPPSKTGDIPMSEKEQIMQMLDRSIANEERTSRALENLTRTSENISRTNENLSNILSQMLGATKKNRQQPVKH